MTLPSTQSQRSRTRPITWACTLVIVAAIVGLYIASRPPRGESELAIWDAIQADKRVVGANHSTVTLVRWKRGAHIGDLAPTDTIVVRTEQGRFQIEASAYCVVPDGWKASLGTVLRLDD